MDNIGIGTIWVTLFLGVVPLLGCLLWWWNDIWYALRVKARCSASGTELPAGHMGVPFFGEMLSFIWYFKILRRPDDFINSKRRRYNNDAGMYRTHLFGSPSIISCSSSLNKFVFQSETNFTRKWPTLELVGRNALVSVEGRAHTRIRSFISRTVNQPDALCRIALMVQPRVIAALQSWAEKGRVIGYKEAKKVTFENMGKFFASLEPGPLLDTLDELLKGVINGYRAYPINFPGSAYRHALKCRNKVVGIFRKELEERRKNEVEGREAKNDLMDGLMRLKDDEGNQLSDIEVLDNIIALIVGGYEATSLSITSALYYLAKYPSVVQKLREENMLLSKNSNGEPITRADFSKLKYTNKVVEETIRMANVVSVVFRTAVKDIDYKGYKIPKGWTVILWLRYLHIDPDNFDDPMCFNPDRWNESTKPEAFQSFGGGTKICAGNMLARLQLVIFIHHLVTGYKWELINPDGKMNYLPHPKPADGVEISFSKL